LFDGPSASSHQLGDRALRVHLATRNEACLARPEFDPIALARQPARARDDDEQLVKPSLMRTDYTISLHSNDMYVRLAVTSEYRLDGMRFQVNDQHHDSSGWPALTPSRCGWQGPSNTAVQPRASGMLDARQLQPLGRPPTPLGRDAMHRHPSRRVGPTARRPRR
jgi:hypothetical protein